MISQRLAVAMLVGFLALSFPGAYAQEATMSIDRDEIIHVLNRTSFGIRPGEVEKVQQMGLENYLQRQLHPETMDDANADQAVSQLPMLQLSQTELHQMYYEEKKKQFKKFQAQGNQQPGQGQGQGGFNGQPGFKGQGGPGAAPMMDGNTGTGVNGNEQQPPPPPRAFPTDPAARQAAFMQLVDDNKSIMAITQLEQAKLIREIESKRQLQEVLVDFWENHFNVDVKKKEVRVYAVSYDRDTIRPHIWGSFRELLEATAKSPAMLYYLDNASNTAPRELTPQQQAMMAQFAQKKLGLTPPDLVPTDKPKKMGGINENYAREIMELHTLGVDGGYTQKDVQEVARCFTGWSIDKETGEFFFRTYGHDNGEKVVLGHVIPAGGGIKDGEMVMDILCSTPQCAHFIAKEMCQRFVSDDPSPALVDRIAGVFMQTQGNLRSVTEAILTSPEFRSPSTFGNKIKSPVEFAVSAVRASESTIVPTPPTTMFEKFHSSSEAAAILGKGKAADRISESKRQSLNWHIAELGEPIYACTPPTGYKEVSKTWVSPGALIERLNLAMALTEQNVSDVNFGTQNILAGVDLDKPEEVLNQCVSVLLQNNITDSTRKVLTQAALPAAGTGQTVNASKLIALIIGSPEFQRK